MSDLYEPCKYWDPFVERYCPLDEGEGEEEAPPAFVSAIYGGSGGATKEKAYSKADRLL